MAIKNMKPNGTTGSEELKEIANGGGWIVSPETPFTDLAHMLMELDEGGLIPTRMRPAIYQHAVNNLDTLPTSIRSLAQSLAAAVTGEVGLGNYEVANSAYGMAALAEQIHGWQELASRFESRKPL